MNILLVEDDAGLVELITAMLEDLGFSVMTAISGAEALVLLDEQIPDLMLLDYSLPDMNGKELIEALNEKQVFPPPFIITTGQGDERIAVDMMKLGAMDYVIKDVFFLEKLPDVIQRQIGAVESENKLKYAEEALVESEGRFRAFMNASKDPTFIKDEQLRYLFANEQTARLFHTTTADIIGKTDSELDETNQMSPCQSSDKRALESREPFTIEETFGERIFEVTKLPLQLPNNKMGVGGVLKDVTESKHADDLILKNKKRLEYALESVEMGAWALDLTTGDAWRSFEHDKIFGYPKLLDVWTSDMFFEHVVPEDRAMVHEKFTKAVSAKKDWNFECRINRKDGCIRWISGKGHHELLQDQGNVMMFGIVQDITDRKLADEKVRDSEQKYKALYENAPLSYQSLDENGTFKDVNPSWLETLGYDRDEVIGKKYADFLHPDWGMHFEENFPAFKKRGYVSDVQYKIRHKLGHYIDISFEGCIGYNPDGSFRQTYCVFQDVTARLKAEAKLKISEERFRLLYNESPDMHASITPDDSCIIMCNDTLLKNIGYTREEVVGAPIYKIYHQDCMDDVEQAVHQFRTTGEVNNRELILKRKDGSKIEVSLKVYAVRDEEGKILHSMASWRDITEKKKAEEKIRAAEKNLERTFDLSPSIICKADLKGGFFIEASSAVTRILGYSVEEFTSIPFMELIHPDDQQKTTDEKGEQLEGREVTFFENRYLCKDGAYKWMAWHGTIPDKDGIATAIGSDISGKKETEKALQQSEERLRLALKSASQGLYDLDLQTGETIVSAEYALMLGFDPQIFVETNTQWVARLHPDDYATVVANYKNYVTGVINEYKVEFRQKTKAGDWIWILSMGSVVERDADGKPLRMLGTHTNITERKKAEQEKSETLKKLETTQAIAKLGGWELDISTNELFWTAETYRIHDTSPEEFDPTVDLGVGYFLPESRLRISNALKAAVEDGVDYDLELETLTTKGRRIDVRTTGVVTLLDGKPVKVAGIFQDITEHKKAEDEIRKLSTSVKQSPLMTVITDVEGRLEYVNPIFTEITRYARDEVIGKKASILKSGKQDAVFYKEMWETIASGVVWRGQFQNRKKNGELFWESASISAVLNDAGDAVNYIKVGEDITQQKEIEEQLNMALEKALESDRLKSAFLANMSHEIRTPMNGILGFVNLLNKPNLSESQIGAYSSIINKSGERLLSTINDIIDISKIESGEVHVSMIQTNINTEIEELYSFFLPEATKKGLSLLIEPALSGEVLSVFTDNQKLHGILTNLIKNAIKYTEKGEVSFGYLLKNDAVEFHVKDTGIGIPQDRVNAVFNRFEQADIEDAKVREGSGLGLAISQAYTEMIGGELRVESEEGKGSTFILTIPYEEGMTKPAVSQVDVSCKELVFLGALNVLVVEDDAISAEFLGAILKDTFEVMSFVDNGLEAVQRCENDTQIDLVLLDIKMPGMNGYEVAQQIRTFNKDVLIIAQTAYSMVGDFEKSIKAGCDDHVAKPIDKELLLDKICKNVRKKRAL